MHGNNANNLEYKEKANPEKISKNQNFQNKLELLKKCDKSSLYIIADFDDTFTKKQLYGKRSKTSYRVITTSKFIPKEVADKSQKLSEKYRSYETDLTIDFEIRDKYVKEWYEAELNQMAKAGLDKSFFQKVVEESIEDGYILFRNGMTTFFELIEKYNIPLIIISAGIKEIIEEEFKALLGEEKYKNLIEKKLLFIIANYFKYNDKKVIEDFSKPVIYSFNKCNFINNEMMGNKKEINVVFFGDHLNDIDALDKLDYSTVLGIGFGNNPVEKISKEYDEKYDAVIQEDGDFWFINNILVELYNKN